MNNLSVLDRRFKYLGLMTMLLMAAVLARMFDKQIVEHDKYVALADDQQRFEKTEIAQRGKIYAKLFSG